MRRFMSTEMRRQSYYSNSSVFANLDSNGSDQKCLI
jgi:hypothetical protein